MPAKNATLSFHLLARTLPDSPAVRRLHEIAAEVFREWGGEAVQRHVKIYESIVDRWQAADAERPVAMREGLRAMGAVERGYEKLRKLHEHAYLEARAAVFRETGTRIELPRAPEDSPELNLPRFSKEEDRKLEEVLAHVEEMSARADEVTAATDHAETQVQAVEDSTPPSGKQVKLAMRRLASARVSREACEKLRIEAKSGRLNRRQFAARVQQLLGIAA